MSVTVPDYAAQGDFINGVLADPPPWFTPADGFFDYEELYTRASRLTTTVENCDDNLDDVVPAGQNQGQLQREILRRARLSLARRSLPQGNAVTKFFCDAGATTVIAETAIFPLGPNYDYVGERAALHRYFAGTGESYALSAAQMNAARNFVAAYPNTVGRASTPDATGLYSRPINFGAYGTKGGDAEMLDGLLGSATGWFRNGELVGVSDTFNFDHKDRGAWWATAGTDYIRGYAARSCIAPQGFSVAGGEVGP
jgi:hypothetical protein